MPCWWCPNPRDSFMDTSGDIERLRRMTPAEKLAVMHSLIRTAYDLKGAHLRALHPEWSEEQVRDATRRSVGGDRS